MAANGCYLVLAGDISYSVHPNVEYLVFKLCPVPNATVEPISVADIAQDISMHSAVMHGLQMVVREKARDKECCVRAQDLRAMLQAIAAQQNPRLRETFDRWGASHLERELLRCGATTVDNLNIEVSPLVT
jgi:hypothetical protein